MPDWEAMFVPGVPLLENILRGTVTFFVLLILIRLVGHREAGGLGVTDVLIIVLVAGAAGPALYSDESTIIDCVVVIVTMLFWSVAVDAIAYRLPTFARIVKARPRSLIENGELDRRAMHREFMTHDELLSQLRLHGIEDISRVKRAYIEPNGMISVVTVDGAQNEPTERPEAL